MPNINKINVPTYEAIQPYHYIYDNLPIAALILRQNVLNDAVDFNTNVLENSIGSRVDLSARLDQSLDSNGDLKTSAVDITLHNIGSHSDGIYDGISYVRMNIDERQKLAQIEDGANPNIKVMPGKNSIEIAEEELRQGVIQFYIKRPIGNSFELFKLADMEFYLD